MKIQATILEDFLSSVLEGKANIKSAYLKAKNSKDEKTKIFNFKRLYAAIDMELRRKIQTNKNLMSFSNPQKKKDLLEDNKHIEKFIKEVDALDAKNNTELSLNL